MHATVWRSSTAVTEHIFIISEFTWQCLIKISCTKFHENLEKGLVADTRSPKDVRMHVVGT